MVCPVSRAELWCCQPGSGRRTIGSGLGDVLLGGLVISLLPRLPDELLLLDALEDRRVGCVRPAAAPVGEPHDDDADRWIAVAVVLHGVGLDRRGALSALRQLGMGLVVDQGLIPLRILAFERMVRRAARIDASGALGEV